MNRVASLALGAALLAAQACKPAKADAPPPLELNPVAAARAARLAAALALPDSSAPMTAPLAQWVMPHALREISGLALTGDGRLLVEQDELGAVWEVDYRRGTMVKKFSLGQTPVKGDFEAIAIAHDSVYLMTSKGVLYAFREGADGTHVDYTVHDTGLRNECEFEALTFDPALDALVLVCKHVYSEEPHHDLVLYRWSFKSDSATRLTRLAIPFAGIIGTNSWKTLHPSDITIDPFTGNYVILVSIEKVIFEITPTGSLIFARSLPAGHDQAEGIAITKDSILIISDEAKTRPAAMTLYKWR